MAKRKGGSGSVPPVEHRFKKGQSGNRRGRPKGSIDKARVTRKVAFSKIRVKNAQGSIEKTAIEVVFDQLKALAGAGKPAAGRFLLQLQGSRSSDTPQGGMLLVPAQIDSETLVERERLRTADAPEPGTVLNIEADVFCEAAAGDRSELGDLLMAHHEKWHVGHSNRRR